MVIILVDHLLEIFHILFVGINEYFKLDFCTNSTEYIFTKEIKHLMRPNLGNDTKNNYLLLFCRLQFSLPVLLALVNINKTFAYIIIGLALANVHFKLLKLYK